MTWCVVVVVQSTISVAASRHVVVIAFSFHSNRKELHMTSSTPVNDTIIHIEPTAKYTPRTVHPRGLDSDSAPTTHIAINRCQDPAGQDPNPATMSRVRGIDLRHFGAMP